MVKKLRNKIFGEHSYRKMEKFNVDGALVMKSVMS